MSVNDQTAQQQTELRNPVVKFVLLCLTVALIAAGAIAAYIGPMAIITAFSGLEGEGVGIVTALSWLVILAIAANMIAAWVLRRKGTQRVKMLDFTVFRANYSGLLWTFVAGSALYVIYLVYWFFYLIISGRGL